MKKAATKKEKRFLEKTALVGSLIFSVVIIAFVFINKDDRLGVFSSLSKVFSGGLGDVNYNLNCSLPENKNTPYCQEKQAKIQSDWKAVSVMGNRGSKFRLYRK